ncbi:MAG TPA: glycosyltransferase [Paludibaculum sp.]|jgi:glycosyltransferase involved in cell wall biosynthesis
MRVALYYPWIYLTSGAERTLLRLTEYSRHDWTLFTNRFQPATTFPEFAERRVVVLGEGVSVDRSVGATARTCWKLVSQKLPLDGFDALLVVGEGVGDLVLLRNHQAPAVNLCLTPLRIAFDDVYRSHWMEGAPLWKRAAVALGCGIFRAVDRLAWSRYRRVFCISGEVRRRAVQGGLAKENEMQLLFPGLGVEGFGEDVEYQPFFFIPGRIMWTKNIELGIQAFLEFVDSEPEFAAYRLVVGGIVDAKSQPYLERLREMAGGDPRIEFRIHPSDAELASLYRTCRATLFTAFNEDYGIVPLEAMSFGKPVISVNRGGPRETLQHNVSGFLEEPNASSFASRMAQLARSPDLTRSLGESGRRRARNYDWRVFAETIDKTITEIVERIPKRPDSLTSFQQAVHVARQQLKRF